MSGKDCAQGYSSRDPNAVAEQAVWTLGRGKGQVHNLGVGGVGGGQELPFAGLRNSKRARVARKQPGGP